MLCVTHNFQLKAIIEYFRLLDGDDDRWATHSDGQRKNGQIGLSLCT